jgi:hypothetical protein
MINVSSIDFIYHNGSRLAPHVHKDYNNEAQRSLTASCPRLLCRNVQMSTAKRMENLLDELNYNHRFGLMMYINFSGVVE